MRLKPVTGKLVKIGPHLSPDEGEHRYYLYTLDGSSFYKCSSKEEFAEQEEKPVSNFFEKSDNKGNTAEESSSESLTSKMSTGAFPKG